jgi:hypothetical protein
MGCMNPDLGHLQHGAFSREQALGAGISLDAIKSRVRRGTWRRLYSGVYATEQGRLERLTELWAAVLYAGRDAVISHETAAELHGLRDAKSRLIHVSIPARRKVAAAPGLCVHRLARVYDPPDAHRDPPQTTIEETLLDLAQTSTAFKEVVGWLTGAFGRELTNETRLLYAISLRSKVRWRGQLLEVLHCGESGDHSALEYRYTKKVERAHGLPEADRQVPFTLPNGQTGRRDRVYRRYGVAIELDGRLAHRREDKWRDQARDRAAIAAGLLPLRYGWVDVDDCSCGTAIEVGKILQTRGWRDSVRPCSPACAVVRRA